VTSSIVGQKTNAEVASQPSDGVSLSHIEKDLGIGHNSVYRINAKVV